MWSRFNYSNIVHIVDLNTISYVYTTVGVITNEQIEFFKGSPHPYAYARRFIII